MVAPYTGTGGAGEYTIRGIDIKKLVEGFSEEGVVLKNYVRVTPCTAREVRYYSKTAGFLTGPTTTLLTTTLMANTAPKSLPVVVEPSYTRATGWVKKYFAESPLITVEDLSDCDFDIWADMIKDIVRAVNYNVDAAIYTAIKAGAGTGAATAAWTSAATADPIKDILTGIQTIRSNSYDTSGAVLYLKSSDYKNLLAFLINVKGSSIPNWASDKIGSGKVMELLGLQVVVSENATAATATIFCPNVSCVWKEFIGLQTSVVDDPGIGKKVRVWAEGVALSVNPNSVYTITGCA